MSRPHAEFTMKPGEKRLRNLAIAHVAIGLGAGVLAPIEVDSPFDLAHILVVPLVALAACQSVLLAVWVVTSTSLPWKHLAGLVGGAVYLEALVAHGLQRELLGVTTATFAFTWASLLALRGLGFGLVPQADPSEPGPNPGHGLRFSIRDLMLATAVVGMLRARSTISYRIAPHDTR